MQAELLNQLKDRLSKSMQALDPEAMARKWFSPTEMFQKMQDLSFSSLKSAHK
jgi:antirestriction protein